MKKYMTESILSFEKVVTDKWTKEELKESIMDMLDISSYILKVFILPSLLFLIPYFILTYLLKINGTNIFNISLLTIFYLVFSIINIILCAFTNIPLKLKDDLIKISKLTRELSAEIKDDLEKNGKKKNLFEVYNIVFLTMILPIVKEVIKEKFSVLGQVIILIIEKLFSFISKKITNEEKKLGEDLDEEDIEITDNKLENFFGASINLFVKPFKFVRNFSIISFVLFFSIWIKILL